MIKKTYQKPTITQVRLIPEETVLGGCKTSGFFGPNATPCDTTTPCSNDGS